MMAGRPPRGGEHGYQEAVREAGMQAVLFHMNWSDDRRGVPAAVGAARQG